MDSSNSDREFVAKIGYTDAPEAGSGRMPGFSAINAAGDADGRRTTVAPSATVAPGLENARQQSGMPHLFFRICRSTSAKRARVATSRMPDAKFLEDTVAVARQSNERSSSSSSHGVMPVPCAV